MAAAAAIEPDLAEWLPEVIATGQLSRPIAKAQKWSSAFNALACLTRASSCRFLACRVAATHCALRTGLGFVQLAFIVTIRGFSMVFGTGFVLAGGFFMGSACCCIGV
jgi:hypothetical protein